MNPHLDASAVGSYPGEALVDGRGLPAARPAHGGFRAVYDAHFAVAWRWLRRLGVRSPDLMDQTQKVFLVVHSRLGDFEGRSSLSTWVFGICRRVASDYRRSAPIRCEVVTDPAELDAVSSSPREPHAASKTEFERIAEQILEKLPEPQRIVFVLFELEEMSGEDIATLLAVPVGTVRSRLRLARESFRREVKRHAAMREAAMREIRAVR
jgi:RNA polymerase sigma-70 factor (ECF subfamily)